MFISDFLQHLSPSSAEQRSSIITVFFQLRVHRVCILTQSTVVSDHVGYILRRAVILPSSFENYASNTKQNYIHHEIRSTLKSEHARQQTV
jgi:hypothetical protein